jgi:hypothetical protein
MGEFEPLVDSIGTLREFIGDILSWSNEFPRPDNPDKFLDDIYVLDYEFEENSAGFLCELCLAIDGEIIFAIPGLDGIKLVVGDGDEAGFTYPTASLSMGDKWAFTLSDITLALRFDPSILKPASLDGTPPTAQFAEIEITGSISIDSWLDITVNGTTALKLPPCMVGNTGVVISADDVKLDLSRTTTLAEITLAGFDENFMGIFIGRADVQFPDGWSNLIPENLSLYDCVIGSGGFSGGIKIGPYNPAKEGKLFGFEFGLKTIDIVFKHNTLIQSSLAGTLTLPYFDAPVGVDIALDLGGSLSVTLTGSKQVIKDGIFAIDVDSLGFAIDHGLFTVKLSGKVTPLFENNKLEWPSFKVDELSIDSQGNVHLDGGWINLPNQYSLDFYGFQMEITKLGFGKTDDDGKWLGFSGGLKLADGLPAGASVEGLRITWYKDSDTRISLNGIGVEFEIPDVLRFKGEVSYHYDTDAKWFDGSIKLELMALGLDIDGTLVIGSGPGYTYFGIYLDAELPSGIPLFSTGLSLYGMAGLFALNMKPKKGPAQPWYEIPPTTTDWYHNPPPPGVTDLPSKWTNEYPALALGAGITIGTLSDNGFTFAGKVLLVISFPGPILLIQGSANLLKERAKLADTEDALFSCLAVLDFRAGTFLVGLDAQYKYGTGGELIDIRGGAEAFFSLSDPNSWHLYVGLKEPRDRRIRAEIFKIFEANSYFMLDSSQLAMGAWLGYDQDWSFGPLGVIVEAWIEGNTVVSWKPVHLYGDLWLHGKAGLKVFSFCLGLSVDARLAANVFDPFSLVGEFTVGIDLPWPLHDLDASITLKWGPKGTDPPLPLPLKEVAIEHFKVTTSWPLARGSLLLPNYSDPDGFIQPPDTKDDLIEDEWVNVPVVPLDARPHITFARPIWDDAGVGVNIQSLVPEYERIGDPTSNTGGPTEVRYSLTAVVLEKKCGSDWTPVAGKFVPTVLPNMPQNLAPIYGSWAPIPATPDGGGTNTSQVKLWLWSKSPFDYTCHSGASWDEWFTDRFQDYPCPPVINDREICIDFEGAKPGQQLHSPWTCEDDPRFTIGWLAPEKLTCTVLPAPVAGRWHALYFPAGAGSVHHPASPNIIAIRPPEPAREMRIWLAGAKGEIDHKSVDFRGRSEAKLKNPYEEAEITFTAKDVQGNNLSGLTMYKGQTGGLGFGASLVIDLPRPSLTVTMLVRHSAVPVTAEGVEMDGTAVQATVAPGSGGLPDTVSLSGESITRVVVHSTQDGLLHQITYAWETVVEEKVEATGFDNRENSYGPFYLSHHVIDVRGSRMTRIEITSEQGFGLVRACATIGLSQSELTEREEMMQHLSDGLARWSQTGDILEPNTHYRLTICTRLKTTEDPINVLGGTDGVNDLTEYAYFKTGGPPGLQKLLPLPGSQNSDKFKSGLDDLTLYVHQTVPATVPEPGELPLLPRPVYRSYDVGVEFNEDYVDLMYRISGRDLGLYLYDSNNRPVRDAAGRLVVLSNRWGRAESLVLTQSDKLWIQVINTCTCASLDTTVIPRSNTLSAAANGQVLDADFVYEARLIPLLLHEAFSAYLSDAAVYGPAEKLGRWQVVDQTTGGGPSCWKIGEAGTPLSRFIWQSTSIGSDNTNDSDPVKPGTILLYGNPSLDPSNPGQPGNWTDYRLRVYLRSGDDGAIGLVFRYQGTTDPDYYRFSMDRARKYRRLIRVVGRITTVLAEDDFVFQPDRDYLITVEAIGSALRIYQDGDLIFSVDDASLNRGTIGLYCWANPEARFSDVCVDDFQQTAPVVYRFKFTTSNFTDFFHHIHSYQDESWRTDLPPAADISPEVNQVIAAISLQGLPSDAETRAYDSLLDKVLGQDGLKNPPQVQVTRVEKDGEALGFLVQSPEPIDWKRTLLQAWHSGRCIPTPELPVDVKLTDLTFGVSQPDEEALTLLLRQPVDLSGYRIESRGLPGPTAEPTGDTLLGPLDILRDKAWTFVDENDKDTSSLWSISNDELRQTNMSDAGIENFAIIGQAEWQDYRVSTRLRSDDDGAIGMLFRYQDTDNYYLFSMDNVGKYRRLVKKKAGFVTILWDDRVRYTVGSEYVLTLGCIGDRLCGYLNGVQLFNLVDADLQSGKIGLYSCKNNVACFAEVRVAAPIWTTYCTFSGEELMPAGTKVRLCSGNETVDPTTEAGVIKRFVAGLNDPAQLHFSDMADLRIVAPHTTQGHHRTFLPDSAYNNIEVKVFRKADGTGMFIFVPNVSPPGARLDPGQYRFRMTYNRDNRVFDPQSQVLSQAGNTSPEIVTIDIPWVTRNQTG